MTTPAFSTGRPRRRVALLPALALLPLVALLLSACGTDAAPEAESDRSRRVAWGAPAPAVYVPSDEHETEADWAIAREAVEWGREQDLDLLPVGEVVAMLGMTFLGTTYEPGTLELPGEEALVVNLRAFDCVTLVEHLLVLARMVVAADEATLANESAFREHYRSELTSLRYRDGRIDGYPSRLHYFSDWIRDGERKGRVHDVTADLGGIPDDRPIHFMTSNPTAYRQLQEDPANVEAIAAVEARLNVEPRFFIPQEEIAGAASGIRNGDVIAAVSTLDGLDIAHTGIALWHAGRLHLLHAPLVGETVELSARPLAERMLGISSQKGIMVARPLQP
ncbi:MAG: N-acetylmuramoyl-L-alanine amidase-like domain-containing protein [Gemmatimonadota bacterium]